MTFKRKRRRGKIPKSKRARFLWTYSSIDCYSRGCNCETCVIKNTLETECLMKTTVFKLILKYGEPTKKDCLRTHFKYSWLENRKQPIIIIKEEINEDK